MSLTVGASAGLMMSVMLPAAMAFQWRDFVAGFDPYKDEDTLHLEETARLGFVQLNSGSTSFNTTLNLTGPILLGLGIATATLFYAYFNAFNGASGSASGGYGTYRAKRETSGLDTNSLDPVETPLAWLDSLHEQLATHNVTEDPCRHLLVCHVHREVHPRDLQPTLGKFITTAMERINALEGMDEDLKGGKVDGRMDGVKVAAEAGGKGRDCFKMYHECHLNLVDVERVVGMA